MSTTPDWRSPTAADDLNRLGRTGFAQEFLRRNSDYQQDYDRMARRIAAGAMSEDAATADLTRRWGLSFRLRPKPSGRRGARPVATRTRS